MELHITVFYLLVLWTGTDLLYQPNVFLFKIFCSYSLGKKPPFHAWTIGWMAHDLLIGRHLVKLFRVGQGFRMVLELIKIPWVHSDVHSDHSSSIVQSSLVHNDLLFTTYQNGIQYAYDLIWLRKKLLKSRAHEHCSLISPSPIDQSL